MDWRVLTVKAAIIAAALSLAFATGAAIQERRVRDGYIRQGYSSATYDAIFDGRWLYLGCLSDDCAHEKRASDFIVRRGEERLRTGKFVSPSLPQAADPRRKEG